MRNVRIKKKKVLVVLNKIYMCLPNDLLLLNKLNKLWCLRFFFHYIYCSFYNYADDTFCHMLAYASYDIEKGYLKVIQFKKFIVLNQGANTIR